MNPRVRVGLFVTCLVDFIRPSIGFAAAKLLEDAGCLVEAPPVQTCCGQPAYNSGDRRDTIALARNVIAAFKGFDYVVAPSGSCAGMIKVHYPELFPEGSADRAAADELAGRTYELVSFLVDVMNVDKVDATYKGTITYHDSCSGLRELGISRQPRELLRTVRGLQINELTDTDVCCGFGGTFCVKYPDISNKMVEKKVTNIVNSGADTLLAGDLGCLMNMAGKLKRLGSRVKVRHIAEVLAGNTSAPPIAEV
ncbi:MAG: (Fe-S)-binding protein [Hyphomicrobiales bacterium]